MLGNKKKVRGWRWNSILFIGVYRFRDQDLKFQKDLKSKPNFLEGWENYGGYDSSRC